MRAVLIAFVLFFVVPMVCCMTCMSSSAKPTAASAPAAPPPSPVADPRIAKLAATMPEQIGDMQLLSSSVDHWKNPWDRHIIAEYAWNGRAGDVRVDRRLLTKDASLQCDARILLDAPEPSSCLGGQHAKIGAHPGCYFKADAMGGAAVSWPGCILQFTPAGLSGRSRSDAIAAAAFASNHVDSFRPAYASK